MANWVLRAPNGKVKGPYSTEAILQKIDEGQLLGQEPIAKVPDGQWSVVSAVPEFYDRILNNLESKSEPLSDEKRKQREETVIAHPPQRPLHLNNKFEIEQMVQDIEKQRNEIKPSSAHSSVVPKKPGSENTSSVIELKSMPNFEKEDVQKKFLLPLIFTAVVILISYFFIFEDDSSLDSDGKISLVGPAGVTGTMSPEDLKIKMNEALIAIEADDFQNYIRAQNILVNIVENSRDMQRTQQLEARALLCAVYKYLWPHTRQSVQDIYIVKNVRDTTRALDVISPYGDLCDVVRVSTQASFRETRSTLDSVFAKNLSGFNMLPILYHMKGELLDVEKDYLNAIGFLGSANQLWPKWNRPAVDLAIVYIKSRKPEDLGKASQLLRTVLERNPSHKTARYAAGIMEFEEHKNSDNAFTHLSIGVDSNDRANPTLETKALRVYAELLLARNQKADALFYAEKALSMNPNNSELKSLVLRLGGDDKVVGKDNHMQMLYMGETYEKQGDCLAAQAEYKVAFEMDNKNGVAALKAGKCLWQLNQSFEAIEWLKKAIRAEPKLVTSYVTLSDYLSQRYDFAAAAQILATANRESPNNYEILRGMAILEYRKGNLRAAIDYAKRSVAIYDGDIETYNILSRASAELAAVMVGGDPKTTLAQEAFRFASKAIEMNPTDKDAQINYANVVAIVQGSSIGVRYLEEKARAYSFELEYRVALGELLMREEKFIDSQRVFENIVALDKKNKRAWLGLGISLKARGNNSQALKAFLEAAVLDPTDVEASFQAGKIYYETDAFDKAIDQFKRVNSVNPHYPRAFFYIGKAAMASGNYDLALEAAKKEQQANPQIADSYILMGEVYAARRQYTDCSVAYSQAIKYRPQGAITYVRAAECYRQSGSLEVAEDMLDLAQERESGLADIYREQGAIYEVKGDARSAYKAYSTYLALSPNALDKAAIESKLRSLGGR